MGGRGSQPWENGSQSVGHSHFQRSEKEMEEVTHVLSYVGRCVPSCVVNSVVTLGVCHVVSHVESCRERYVLTHCRMSSGR